MRIGIDLRIMQMGHQQRGIGQTLRRGLRALHDRLPADDVFVAFVDDAGPSVTHELEAATPGGRRIEQVPMPAAGPRWRRLLRDNVGATQAAVVRRHADLWIQFDPLVGVPPGIPAVVLVHDLIPLELGDRYPRTYLPSFTAARRLGLGVRDAAVRAVRRFLYRRNLTLALERAGSILTNSDHTAAAVRSFAAENGVHRVAERLRTTPLGSDPPNEATGLDIMERVRIEALELDRRPFVLYLGGVDDRRRLDTLVDAFNQLRARGRDLQLVLAGDSLSSVEQIGIERNRRAVERSSYRDDIQLFGYVDEEKRSWLYRHAVATVFPSELEGFGLPVIEAMAHRCPVVAFEGGAVAEVAGGHASIVEPTWEGLANGIVGLLDLSDRDRADLVDEAERWSQRFGWDALGDALADFVEERRPG